MDDTKLPSVVFGTLDQRRTERLRRARAASRLTIPTLFPESWFSDDDPLPNRYSSFATRGVMSLAARLTTLQAPTNGIMPYEHTLDESKVPPDADPVQMNRVREEITLYDRKIAEKLASTNYREQVFVLNQHKIVVSDAIMHLSDDYVFSVYTLDNFVVRRSPDGAVWEAIIREWVDPDTLPSNLRNLPKSGHNPTTSVGSSPFTDAEPMYTQLCRKEGSKDWYVRKEFRGVVYETGEIADDILPYFFSVWTRVAGQDYGRSLCEDMLNDILTDEELSKALVEGSVANSRFKMGVRPGGNTEIKDIDGPINGEFVPAEPDDVFAIGLGSQIQVQGTAEARREHRRELGKAFLMSSSIQRNGDRVTATEMQILASEIDESLGGVTTSHTRDVQLPLIRRFKHLMIRDKLLPKELTLGKNSPVSLQVRTGVEALGRELNNNALSAWAQEIATTPAAQYAKWNEFGRKSALNKGLNPKELMMSDQEIAAMQQSQQQQALQNTVLSQAVSSAGKIAETNATQ